MDYNPTQLWNIDNSLTKGCPNLCFQRRDREENERTELYGTRKLTEEGGVELVLMVNENMKIAMY